MPSPFHNAPKPATPEMITENKTIKQVIQEQQAAKEVLEAEGITSEATAKVETRTVDEVDLTDLDETTLFKYPIEAKYLNDSAMILIKPKDSSKVLRWCYYNNGVLMTNKDKTTSVNVGRYRHWGFEFATIHDIEGGEEALVEGIVEDGGKIVNYDTVLMKIDKIRLMGHYKKNLLQSIQTVDMATAKAAKAAQMDVQAAPGYSKALSTHPQAKIEFYSND